MIMPRTAKAEVEGIAQQGLFDQVPFAVAIIDAA